MQAYKIMAKNTITGMKLQKQFLDGTVVTNYERACDLSKQFAENQEKVTRDTWVGEVDTYTVKK